VIRDLKPLFRYMARYRWGYLWGTLALMLTNAIWVLFPKVLEKAVNDLNYMNLNSSATRQKILFYAGLLIGIALRGGF
jgi:ATP-binding cassette subfamily B multidrug efflux pump